MISTGGVEKDEDPLRNPGHQGRGSRARRRRVELTNIFSAASRVYSTCLRLEAIFLRRITMMETKMTKRIAAMMRMVVGSIRNILLGQVVKKHSGDLRCCLRPTPR